MKISLNWLKKYVEIDLPPVELANILTTIGLEVEGIEEVELVKGGLKGVVVGEVLSCEKHADADKLSVTTVNIGGEEALQIVCGAPNVAAGQKVLVATIGTTLYNGAEPWTIKKGKIRGQESAGMICAEDELGLGTNHDGIMILDSKAKIGQSAAEYLGLQTDIVFEIGLTPNRSDATSHIGVARDLCAYLKINNQYSKDIKDPDLSKFSVAYSSLVIDVEVREKEACPRYSGISLVNVKVGQSPKWMVDHLSAIGIRSINNIVDITNFVLHEYGQPLHAFDADKIDNKKVIVKMANEGEKFVSLDGMKRTLHGEDLMICNGKEQCMCIAGVFGGLNSGVTDDTTKIFLESAHFASKNIRRTSTKHQLRTDAAKIFEKGSDPNITIDALKRAALLMVEYAGATLASEIVDIYPHEIKPKEITLSYQKVEKLIGLKLTKEEIHNILRAMEMEINPVNEDQIKVKVPTDKVDVTREVDLIEEILRIYGFNKIPIPTKVNSTLTFTDHPSKRKVKESIANYLSSQGFSEMMGMSLIESKTYEDGYDIDDEKLVYINNTSNIHLDIMRPEMLASGLTSVLHNHNRQQGDLSMYEYGKSYQKTGEEYVETEFLTLFISGKRNEESWKNESKLMVDFYDIKRMVNGIFERLHIDGYMTSENDDPRLEYGLKYHRGPAIMALFGEVKGTLLSSMGIKQKVYYAEIPIIALVKAAKNAKISVSEISKYPSTRRDLALVIDHNVNFEDIRQVANKTDKKLLKEVNLFDVYKNEEQLGSGKKSYAVSFLFEDITKTLQDKEIDAIMNKMVGNMESQLGATIRR